MRQWQRTFFWEHFRRPNCNSVSLSVRPSDLSFFQRLVRHAFTNWTEEFVAEITGRTRSTNCGYFIMEPLNNREKYLLISKRMKCIDLIKKAGWGGFFGCPSSEWFSKRVQHSPRFYLSIRLAVSMWRQSLKTLSLSKSFISKLFPSIFYHFISVTISSSKGLLMVKAST